MSRSVSHVPVFRVTASICKVVALSFLLYILCVASRMLTLVCIPVFHMLYFISCHPCFYICMYPFTPNAVFHILPDLIVYVSILVPCIPNVVFHVLIPVCNLGIPYLVSHNLYSISCISYPDTCMSYLIPYQNKWLRFGLWKAQIRHVAVESWKTGCPS